MATYVISDIHGCHTAFQELLGKAGFDEENDELIIAGDIIDRGKENIEMLRYLENAPDYVTFLMGNHDYDFMGYCEKFCNAFDNGRFDGDFTEMKKDDWLLNSFVNDKYGTVSQLLINYDVTIEDFRKWYNLFKGLDYYRIKEINDKKYIIVHAGYITDKGYSRFCMKGLSPSYLRWGIEYFYMWARSDGYFEGGMNNATVIFGHTPTILDEMFYNDGKVWIKRNKEKNCRFIDIDCGYVYKDKFANANMAIIRLEDEKITYLEDK